MLPWCAPIPVDFSKQELTDCTEARGRDLGRLVSLDKHPTAKTSLPLTSASFAAQFHVFGRLRLDDDHLRLLPAARRELSLRWQRNAAGNSRPGPHRR